MVRLAVILFAVIGAAYLLPLIFGGFRSIAFAVAGYGITWLMLTCIAVGYVSYRATK